MDRNLLVLVILSAFYRRKEKADYDFARALLSNLTNENIDRSKFSTVLSGLAELGYVVQEPFVQVSPKGLSLAETLGRSSLNRPDLEFVERNVDAFRSKSKEEKAQQIESLLNQVSKETLFSGNRIDRIASDKLISNGTKVSYAVKKIAIVENFFITQYVKGFRTSNDLFRTLKWIERAAEEKLKESVIVEPTQEGFVIYSSQDLEAVATNEFNFKRAGREIRDSISELPNVLQAMALKSLIRRFAEKGFAKIGEGRRFIDFLTFKPIQTESGVFRSYEGFDFRFDPISQSVGIAWFDPTVKVMLTLYDYIQNLLTSGLSREEISKSLQGRRIRILPSEGSGIIENAPISEIDTSVTKVQGTNLSYFDYWSSRHQIKLTQRNQPSIDVRLGASIYNYPAEALYLDRDDYEKTELPFISGLLSPPDRVRKTEQFVARVFNSSVDDKFCTVYFGTRLLTWADLAREKFCSGFARISPPNLRFNLEKQVTALSNDPRAVFKYGPYSKEKNNVDTYVLIPSSVQIQEVSRFFASLSSSFKKLGFGSLNLSEDHVLKYSNTIQKEKLPNLLSGLHSSKSTRSIAIVILPSNRSDLYLPFKEEVFRVSGIPVQVIQIPTFRRIANEDTGPTRGTVLQIYTKLLGKREAAWILADAADGKMETMYVGIGFSSAPLTDKRANSFAAMCDPRGGEIDWKPVGVPFGGRYIDEEWFEGFLRFVAGNVRAGVRRIVVFRKGLTYPNEILSMRKVIDKRHELPWSDFNFISITNEERRIFSLQQTAENPESGVFVKLTDSEALLVCSLQHGLTLQQGTVVPIRLIKVFGKSPIEKVVSEYRSLTYLNWASPVSTSKYPLVVNIADRIAQLVRDQGDVRMLESYLPL